MFYMMNFVLPCLLIAVLTLLVFLLPPESGERMSFGVTVLLSFTILIMMLQVNKFTQHQGYIVYNNLKIGNKLTPKVSSLKLEA